ncbi:MAG: gamma-glutamyltransferase family protein, partial [Planctomycetaceae bacterium]|nr:gamma-glutamyltransferase family protein [Planctomycetaceae bacterium]
MWLAVIVCLLWTQYLHAAPLVEASRGMVVSVSPEASDVGLEILKRGGTAVDATVATALALAVTFPEAGNIGGGGFMMVSPGPGVPPVCVEYRETAPAAVNAQTFIKDAAQTGHRVVGVPGTVRGLALAQSRYGKLAWRELVLPAVKLARDGFAIDAVLAGGLNSMLRTSTEFAEFVRVFRKPDGSEWQAGDRLVQPDLAQTLQILADEGPETFYQGRLAEQLVAEMRRGGGFITREDLRNYQAHVRTPIHGTYRGYDIYGPPPPSSGGMVVVGVLNILEQFDLTKHERYSAENLHRVIEATKRVYCDRARYLGDPDFTKIPEHLTSKDYAKQLAAEIKADQATPSERLAPEIAITPEGEQTTHFSVVDGNGMAVANTYTLQNSYGARVVVRGGGYLL